MLLEKNLLNRCSTKAVSLRVNVRLSTLGDLNDAYYLFFFIQRCSIVFVNSFQIIDKFCYAVWSHVKPHVLCV